MELDKGKAKVKGMKKPLKVVNYESLIRCSTFMNVLIGCFPYKIESSRCVLSKLRFAYSTLVMLVYVMYWLWNLYYVNYKCNMNLPEILEINFILIVSPVIILSSYFSNRSIMRVILKVEEASKVLSSDTFCKLAKRIFVKDMLQFIPLFPLILLYLDNQRVMVGIVCWYTSLGAIATNAMYVNNITVMKACFEKINDSLVKIKESLINDEPHLLRRLRHEQKHVSLLAELRTLKRQHLEMVQIIQLINDSFGPQNIAIIMLLFIYITFDLYFNVVLFFTVHLRNSAAKTWYYIIYILLTYFFCNLIFTTWITETTRDQARKIGSNIHRILVNTIDEQLSIELGWFSTQVLQRDNAFTAMGLPLDATLLTKMVCSITTNLLILIQFLFPKPC